MIRPVDKKRFNMKQIMAFAISIIIVILLIGIFLHNPKRLPTKKLSGKIKIAANKNIGYIPIHAAIERGEFKKYGIDVEIDHSGYSGFNQIEALVKGNVHIALSGTYAFVYKSVTEKEFLNNDLGIFATYGTGYYVIKVLVKKKSGIMKGVDLKGKRIAVDVDTQLMFFLDSLLTNYRILASEVTIVDTPIKASVDAFKNDKADAVVTIEPFVTNILNHFSDEVAVLDVDRVFRGNMNFITSKTYAGNNHDKLIAFLKAVDNVSKFLESKSPESLKYISKFISGTDEIALKIIDETEFGLALDQLLLITMENEARWLIKQKGLTGKSVPNYLNNIYPDVLREVKPESVTVIME